MTQRERDRLVALHKADKKLITQKQAARQTGLSERQLRRLLAKLRSEGDQAVVHAARGRASNRKLSAQAEKHAVAILSQPVYAGFGPTLAAEYFEQRHGVQVGRETLRGWMAAAGLWKPRRKSGRPHPWRPRRGCRGELVQWDTSEHDWLEGRGEKLQLIGMIDDASSESLARFVRHDSSEENRRLLKTYLEQNGRPVAFYTDRASLFVNTPKNSAGEDPKLLPPTQIGRALQELGIESITAYSPQAKGRVERSFGTAQDRLVKGLRVAGATTIEQANAYLESEFLPWWNATLRVRPAHPDEAHRELGPEHDLDSALSHVETRRVANDYTIRFRGKSYQIDRKAIVPGLRNGRVRVESRLDGVLVARFGKHELALKRCGAQPQSERARAKSAQPKNTQAESVQAEPASAAAEKAGGKAAGRGGSDWMKDFDLKDSPPVWKAAQASGARPDDTQD